MAAKTLKIGLIGCGHIGKWHTKWLKTVGGNQLVAVCDVNPKNAQTLAKTLQPNPVVYEDAIELIEQADIDAVFICIPPFAHGAIENACIKRGLPMMIEKPVSTDAKTALKIYKMMPKNHIVSVAYNWRYIPNVKYIQKEITKKPCLMFDALWKENLTDARWWWEMKKSGGPLVDQASHMLDLALYLLGPVKEVTGYKRMDRAVKEGDIPDNICAQWLFENGTMGRLHHSVMLNQFGHRLGIDVSFPGVEYSLERTGILKQIGPKGVKTYDDEFDELGCNTASYLRENKAFLKAVRTGDTSDIRCTYAQAVETLLFAESIYKAADTGKKVAVRKLPKK